MYSRFNSSPLRRSAGALALGLALFAATPSFAQLLQSWQFNDPAGTALNAVANAVPGGASFATDLPGVATDGLGRLVIASTNLSQGRLFADIPDVSTGILQLDVNLAGWQFTGITAPPENGPLAEFGLSSDSVQGNDIRVAHIFFEADNVVVENDVPGRAVFSGVARTPGGDGISPATSTATANDHIFGGFRTTPLTIRLIINFQTLVYSVSTSDTNFTAQGTGTIASGKPARYLTLRALDDFTVGGTGGNITIDSITLTYTPPPLIPQAWRDLYFPAPADPALATDTADPDADGILNLLEYATGTDPTQGNPAPTVVGRNGDGFLTLSFTSIANAGLTYEVLGSNDLVGWSVVSSATGAALGAGPQTVPDTVAVNAANPRRFLRLSVRPTP
ncbi:MAG: hypothetical protein H7067_17405 [Burkholderiales bacterium]|nr:hypothetical protein [Opitutaceae bacterium]